MKISECGREYFGYRPLAGGGIAFANACEDRALGHDLQGNHADSMLHRYSVDDLA